MSTMMTPIREDRDKTVMEVKPITSVWFSATGKLLASRRVSGLTPEERQKVKAGEVVLVYANQGHDGRTDFGYRQAVWSGGTIRTRKPSAAVLEAWFRQGLGPTAGAYFVTAAGIKHIWSSDWLRRQIKAFEKVRRRASDTTVRMVNRPPSVE